MPPEFVIKEPSNFMTHCSLAISTIATSLGTSSFSGNSSSPRNWVNKSVVAWLYTILGVPAFKSYCDNCNNH